MRSRSYCGSISEFNRSNVAAESRLSWAMSDLSERIENQYYVPSFLPVPSFLS